MRSSNKIKMTCLLVCIVLSMFVCNREVFSTDIYGILTKNNCIELTSDEHEVIRLNIYKDGLYAIKTCGENDVVLKLVDKNNNEVVPNYKEYDNNYYETYFFTSGNYYVDVKVDRVDKDAVTKLWLFLLDEVVALEEKMPACINIDGQEKYFKYVPNDTDTYVIRSYGKIDLCACIYDDKGILLDRSSSLTGNNFKIVKKLEKDKCYYIRVYSENDIGNFGLEVKKENTLYNHVINLEVDNNLNKDFEGCMKDGCRKCQIKFIPDVDGEFEFSVISNMDLKLDILDENQDSVATLIDNNKNYSVAKASVNASCEYTVNIIDEKNIDGIYKLRVSNFEKLRRGSESIAIGDNKSVFSGKDKFFKFRCPRNGCFNFELAASPDTTISLYDENGKFIKEKKNCAYVTRPTVGVFANKDDMLYVKVSNKNETKEEILVEVSDFGELIKKCRDVVEGEVSGSISEDEPVVLYRFIPQKEGVYTIESTCKFYINGRLYNNSGDLISENNADDMKLRITRRMKEGTIYYIQVTDLYRDSVGDFSIEIEFIGESDVVSLEEDVVVKDEIEYVGDVKKYVFKANGDDLYAINITSDKNVHVRLSNDKEVLVDKEVKHEGIKLSKGDYTIEVFGEDEMVDVGEYCLEIENFTKKVCDAKCVMCDKECQSNLIMADTKDYYVFVPDSDAYYSVYTTGDLSTYIKVYDMDCTLVGEGKVGFDNNEYAVAKFDKGEKYLVEVSGKQNNRTGIYGLMIKKNDSNVGASTWLRVNELTTGIIKDEGYVGHYKVIVPSKGKYLVVNYSDMDISVDVYDKSKQVILPKDDCNFELEGNSLYYIDISAKDRDAVGIYNFKFYNITHEYNKAKCISDNTMQTGEIKSRGQCDYYKFVPYSEDEYIIAQVKGNKLIIEIFDSNGNRILKSRDDDKVSRIILSNKKMYYIKVRCKSLLDIGEYEFFIMSKSKLDEYKSQFI